MEAAVAAPAPDPDDHRRHGARRDAAGARATAPAPRAAQQIGWVIVGGMSLGTLLTLFVVPTIYMLFARRHRPHAEAEAPAARPSEAGG